MNAKQIVRFEKAEITWPKNKIYYWALLGPSLINYCKPWIYPWGIIALSLYIGNMDQETLGCQV